MFIGESVNKKYDKDFKITSSGQLNTEISSLSVTKANAIDILCKHFNINLENTYAIGDHLNDLEMLEYVGQPVAMTNSDEELFKHDFELSVTDNDNDGVLKTILEKL